MKFFTGVGNLWGPTKKTKDWREPEQALKICCCIVINYDVYVAGFR